VAAFGLIAVILTGFCALGAASLSFMPTAFAPFFWAAGLTWIVGMALWVVAMWKAASGEAWRIPIAADIAERIMRKESGFRNPDS
jgi:uncharacterized membrane protein